MKKFKHIKTGLVATQLKNKKEVYIYEEGDVQYRISGDILESSKEWEEIVAKNYEILSFLNTLNNTVYIPCNHERTLYNTHGDFNFAIGLDFCLKHYEIHSVKRLSDGEIFTIGDKAKVSAFSITGTISNIKIVDKTLYFSTLEHVWGDNLNNLIKLGEPLLTTYDGVEIFEGDVYYFICKLRYSIENYKIFKNTLGKDINDIPSIIFAKKENAEEYILFNKPCLSLNDLLSVWGDTDEIELYRQSPLFLNFKELAKTK